MSNVIENIMKMKNMSELMVDLAYSALFLRNKYISEEVMKMEKQIDTIMADTLRHLFRIKDSEDNRIMVVELMDYITDITRAATHIAGLVQKGSVPEFMKNILSETDERIMTVEIKKESILANNTIGNSLVRSRTGSNIISIKRGDEWIFGINKETALKAGDMIVAVGRKDSEKLLKNFAEGKTK
jgi:uncharacterized protein with PhoU and TrkA domain